MLYLFVSAALSVFAVSILACLAVRSAVRRLNRIAAGIRSLAEEPRRPPRSRE